MSLIPYLFNDDPWMYGAGLDPWRYSRPSFDHHFGLGIHPGHLSRIFEVPQRLRQRMAEMDRSDPLKSSITKDGFQVCLDVQQFKPNEITVKQVENAITVEGKHEDRKDEHGYISRHFVRRYVLPSEINAKELVSELSSDGILTLKAPLQTPAIEGKNERVIQIQQTGPARDAIKPAVEEEEKK